MELLPAKRKKQNPDPTKKDAIKEEFEQQVTGQQVTGGGVPHLETR